MSDNIQDWVEKKLEEGTDREIIKETLWKKGFSKEEIDKVFNKADNKENKAINDNFSIANYLQTKDFNDQKIIAAGLIPILLVLGLFFTQFVSSGEDICKVNQEFNQVDHFGDEIELDWDMESSEELRFGIRSFYIDEDSDQSLSVSIEERKTVDPGLENYNEEIDTSFVPEDYILSSVNIFFTECDNDIHIDVHESQYEFLEDFDEENIEEDDTDSYTVYDTTDSYTAS